MGRGVSESDTADRPDVALVSESFVRRYRPHIQPIGRHFKFAIHDHEVIGVVGDIRARGLERTSEPQVYLSSKQDADEATYYAPKDLVIQSTQPLESPSPAVRQIVHPADPEQPISNVRTMEQVVAGETESRNIQMRVLVVFTGVAIVLAGLGPYGLLAFMVSMRQQEFGIRLALGAGPGDLFTLVLFQGASLAPAGLVPGMALAYVAARLLENLLAGVQPADALTFSAAAALCLITTLLGTLFPAPSFCLGRYTAVMRAE